MKGMRKFSTVFAFTFRRQTGTKGWRTTTALMALLLFLLPALLPTAIDQMSGGESVPDASAEETVRVELERVLIVDETPGEADWSQLRFDPDTPELVLLDNLDAAAEQLGAQDLLLHVGMADGCFELSLLFSANSVVESGSERFAVQIYGQFSAIQMQKSGLSQEQMLNLYAELSTPVDTEVLSAEAEDPNAELLEVLHMLLPYLTIMLLYFMVLFYGQSVATSAIAEKSSKLMDTFLVSVSPKAMMLGKVLAISLAAVVQLGLWVAALIAGFAVGGTLLLSVNPASSSGYLLFMETIRSMSGLFDPAGVILGIVIMLSGFLLYCSLAAIGGALASKPEELSSTNLLFTMALVISFLVCLMGGGMMSGEGVTLGWVDWVPFTAILATPSRLMLGQLPVLAGLGSLAIVLLTAVLCCILAGKLYQMMSFYRGAPPKPKQLIELFKNE